MPLDKSGTKESVGNNIRAELSAGKPRRQAIAIALDVARRAKRADGGATTGNAALLSGLLEGNRQADDSRWRDMVQNAAGGNFGRLAASAAGDPGAATNAVQAKDMGNAAASFMGSSTLPMDDPRWQRAKGGSVARDAGGAASSTPWYVRHESNLLTRGPVIGSSMGRADKINTKVPNNSFIVPSHVVSALGQGNSLAGMTQLGKMFPSGGVKVPKPNFPKLPNPPKLPKMAKGGKSHNHVDVALSDGEYAIEPHHVLAVGKGDMARGHRVLKAFCQHVTHKTIEHLKHMPEPVDDGDE